MSVAVCVVLLINQYTYSTRARLPAWVCLLWASCATLSVVTRREASPWGFLRPPAARSPSRVLEAGARPEVRVDGGDDGSLHPSAIYAESRFVIDPLQHGKGGSWSLQRADDTIIEYLPPGSDDDFSWLSCPIPVSASNYQMLTLGSRVAALME